MGKKIVNLQLEEGNKKKKRERNIKGQPKSDIMVDSNREMKW